MAFQKVAPHKIMKFANLKKGGIGIHCLENFVNFSLLLVDEVSVFLKVLHQCNRNFRLFFCFEEKP